LITDESRSVEENERNVRAAFDGGCRWVQLRHRRIVALEFYRSAERLRALTNEYHAMLIVNDRVDVAVAVDADGAHLPAAGLTPPAARDLLGTDKLIGRSVHSVEEIIALKGGGVDYFQFGPVFETASKRAYGAPQGLDELTRASLAASPCLVCAVGGITIDNAAATISAGAGGIAAIGAIHSARDVREQTARLLTSIASLDP
jgi:thiamine-phosphate pyrophosphorylase